MTSGGGQDWRGGRAPRNSSRQEEVAPSWKQSRHTAAGTSRSKGLWPKLRIAMACVALLALVATAIYLWDPQKVHRTHFIVLNLIEQSQDFDSGSALSLPDGIEVTTTERKVTQCHPETLALQTGDADDKANLNEAQTIVIWLQTTFLPTGNGDFRCLIRNSTPNLSDASQYVSLETLKSQLDEFTKKHATDKVLLLVDSAPVNSEWRTGCLHSDLGKVFEEWTSDFKSLVVMLSSPSIGLSEPGPAGSDGKSIFGHFASVGLSALADSDHNQKLTTSEYCAYVSERTDTWIRQHRDVEGQSVIVLPSLEKLAKSAHDFTVIADVIPLSPSQEMPGRKANADISQIEKLWTRRELLRARGGHLWNPLLWNSVTDDLVRAEQAFLAGRMKSAERTLPVVDRTLRELESLTDSICPQVDSLLADRGRALSEFKDLPSLERVKQLFRAEPAKPDLNDVTAFPEDVVISVVGGFPFTSVNLKPPLDVEPIRTRRAAAEIAVSQLLACSDQLTQTVKRMEASLLLSEDRLFTRRSEGTTTNIDADPDVLIRAIDDFSKARDRAETTLFGVFDLTPSLAYWAADTCERLPDADRRIWHNVLSQNTPDADISLASQSAIFDPLKGIESEVSESISDHERAAASLRSECFQLLIRGRALQQSLAFSEPKQGFNAEELRIVTDKLNATQKDTASSQRNVTELIETVCNDALDDSSAGRNGQVRTRHFLRSLLSMTAIKADTRSRVLRALQKRDDGLSSPAKAADLAEVKATAATSTLSVAADEALWMLQVMNLVPQSSNQSELLARAWKAARILEAGEANQAHDAAAEFGDAIRRIWQENQQNVMDALQDATSDSHHRLRIADRQVRLFSGFDTRSRSLHSPTARLRQLNRIQYCLMHADRLLAGQWIAPKDSAPFVQNGWYARASRLWLKPATESVQHLSNEALGIPVSVSDSLGRLETRLADSDQLKLAYMPELSTLDLGEQSKVTGKIGGKVTMIGCADVAGEAAVLVRVDSNSPVEVENNGEAVSVGVNPVDLPLHFHRPGNPGTGECNSVLLRPETFFRGRYTKSDAEISVDPCAPEEFTMERQARPLTASVTVSGNDPRPVVLILDYSSSMTETLTSKPDTARFEEALATLNDLIGSGNLNDSRVILNVYGHRVDYDKAANVMVENDKYKECFSKDIPPGTGALDDIANEFDGTIGNPEVLIEFNKVIKSLRCSKPFGITPLIQAITNALEVNLKDSEGIVIAVTDGDASDASNARKMNLLQKALKSKKATSVNIVAFDVLTNPEVRRKLNATFNPLNINVTDAAQRNQLLNQIIELLGPRSYTIGWNKRSELRTAPLGTEIAELSPGADFTVTFSDVSSVDPIALQPGDVLKLNFNHTERRFLFGRDRRSVSKVADGLRPTNDAPSMLKSIVPPRLSDLPGGKNPAMAVAELSLMLDHERDDLPVRQPAEIAFSVRPASSDSTYRPHVVRETFSSRTGAPGWDLKIDEWPKEQLFLVDAVWKMERTPPDHVLRWNELASFDAIDNTIPVKVGGLPECRAWITLRGNDLQIRLDPVAVSPQPEGPIPLGEAWAHNRVDDIRIEIGSKDTSDQNQAFKPWEIDTKVVRLETGSVRFEFTGEQISPENLSDAQIAFTSAASRTAGAIEVKSFRLE